MAIMHFLYQGFVTASLPINLLMLGAGITIGMVVGVIPGISAASGIALLLPMTQTFNLAPETALILYAGVYYGAKYGGRVPAILLDVPGDIGSFSTRFDGYPLARSGFTGKALAITAMSSFVGGGVAILVLTLIANLFEKIGDLFGPPEYATFILLAFVLVLVLSSTAFIKTLVSLCLGLMMSLVGLDWATGVFRYTFKMPELFNGIDFIIVVVGVLALSEAFLMMERPMTDKKPLPVADPVPTVLPVCWRERWSFFRSSLAGVLIGILPGTGTYVANLAAYRLEKRVAENKEQFGKGDMRGLIAPEAANSACAISAFIPLMTLGIPGSATTAVLFGALQFMNVNPGPALCRTHPEIIWSLIASMCIGNFLLLLFNVWLARLFPKLVAIPSWVLVPMIVVVSFASVYTVQQSMISLCIMVVIGLLAYCLRKFLYPLAPLIIGYVLGKEFEHNFRLSLAIGGGHLRVLFQSPIAQTLWVLILATLAIKLVLGWKARRGLQGK